MSLLETLHVVDGLIHRSGEARRFLVAVDFLRRVVVEVRVRRPAQGRRPLRRVIAVAFARFLGIRDGVRVARC